MTSPERTYQILALLVAGTFFMENLDATVITTAVPVIAKSFSVAPIDLNTGVSAYVLTLGVFIPISGWIADKYGTRKIFAIAIALFTLASLLCGAVTNLPSFIAARILQGIGGAMMVPVGRLVILRVTPKDRLISAIATLTWPGLVAPILGPPVGGFITQYASWPWIFYLNLPLGILAFLLSLRLVPEVHADQVKPFDLLGFTLLGTSILSLTYAIESTAHTFINWPKAAILLFAGTLLLAIAIRHLRRTATPVIDLSSLRFFTFRVTIVGGSFFRAAVNAAPFLLPLLFQLGFGLDAVHSGFLLIAVFAGNLTMKAFTTQTLRRFGFRNVLVVNGVLNVLSLLACAAFSPTTPLALIAVILFLGGMARSLQFTAINTLAFADIPKELTSSANSLAATITQLSMGLGVTLGAVALHIGTLAKPHSPISVLEYRIAFLLVAAVSVIALIDVSRLPTDAGDHVSRRAA